MGEFHQSHNRSVSLQFKNALSISWIYTEVVDLPSNTRDTIRVAFVFKYYSWLLYPHWTSPSMSTFEEKPEAVKFSEPILVNTLNDFDLSWKLSEEGEKGPLCCFCMVHTSIERINPVKLLLFDLIIKTRKEPVKGHWCYFEIIKSFIKRRNLVILICQANLKRSNLILQTYSPKLNNVHNALHALHSAGTSENSAFQVSNI